MDISFIGGGNMAAAMIGGLIQEGTAPQRIHVVDPDETKLHELAQRYGVSTARPGAALPSSRMAVLAVKPQQLEAVARQLAPELGGTLVVSIAAGIRSDTLAHWLGGHTRIVRVMPNTPALVRAGLSGAFAAPAVSDDDRAAAETVLRAIGEVVWVAEESRIDGITAISGSGPAYVFYFMEALQEAARAQGFDVSTARTLAYQTFAGAVALALASEDDAATLRLKVTSKGGTTERAIGTFEQQGLRDIVIAAAAAAATRSRELGDELGRG
ncbi:pyrroline-5-carboxylate reductase [Chitiniphilus purpureus]|uniref:Pyrroline-5-carboxylate reductase n=1 Tax=Chitiniphilus purpureus TaxID=2981137 RepID=A0ABY6DK20_9NEIS|nr:pyrroline-5-carboxylate reductase [Chitiniphilus sp. CD1]UXY14710.1 pyrroline-5-carboxylate reductase [Chitiniphilus sp. CD1]